MPTITLRPQNGPLSVTSINCGTSTPKLGGSIDVSPFVNLTSFTCIGNDIVSLTGYENHANLTLLDCWNNKIAGSIPNLSGMTSMTTFKIYLNLLSGTIPNENIAGLSAIQIFNYSDNQITGQIPTNLNALPTLTRYICYNNKHTGGIPSLTGLTNLERFYCYGNELTGTIPDLSTCTGLKEFLCYENLYVSGQYAAPGRGLSGSIPSLTSCTLLEKFSCYRNALTGNIPSLTGLTALTLFNCYDNLLTGNIPSLAGLTALQTFQCYDNDLSGTIPSLTGLTALQTFHCGGNILTGTIPSNINTLTNLVTFACDNNKLSSTIPSLSGLTKLVLFACDNNKAIPAESVTGVTGSIPDLAGLTALATFRCNDTKVDDYAGTLMPVTLGKFHAFNTDLSVAAIDKILKAFVDGGRNSGDRFVNLGGNRPLNGTPLVPSYTGGITKNNPGSNFSRVGTEVTVDLSNHGYTLGQLVTVTSAVKTTSGSNFSRVGNVVTVSLTSHGFANGQSVTISNEAETAFPAALTGTYTITLIGPDSFSYTTTGSGSLTGTGLATISDATFQGAFKGTFAVSAVVNANQFKYLTVSSGTLSGAGTATIRTTTTSTDGYAYYQNLTRVNRTGGPWNIVINQP